MPEMTSDMDTISVVSRLDAQRLADQQAGGDDGHQDGQQVLQGGEEGDGGGGAVVGAVDQVVAGGVGVVRVVGAGWVRRRVAWRMGRPGTGMGRKCGILAEAPA